MTSDDPTPTAHPALPPEPSAAVRPAPPPTVPAPAQLPAEPVRLMRIPARGRPAPSAFDRPLPGWREFAAWPGSASLVTLCSAACLLGGLWGVLEPTLDDPQRIADRWSVLATVAGYLGCVLAAVWAMCRARAGNPDAVAAAVVAAALGVGYGLVLHLIAPDDSAGGAIAAGVGLLGLAGLWRGWVRAAGAARSAASAPLAAIMAWAVAWPAVLGWRTAIAVAPAGGGTDTPVMAWWAAGWLVLLGALAGLLAAAIRGGDPWSHRDRPFLSRPAMTWVLALVAAACATAALGVQAHVAGLDLLRTDLLPHLAVLVLAGNELRRRAAGAHAGRDAVAVAAIPWVAALMGLGGGGVSGLDLVRGDGWAPWLVQAASSAPGLPLGMTVVGGLLAWRHRSGGLAIGSALALTAGVLGWEPRHPLIAESLATACLVVAAGGWTRGRADVAAAASSAAAACAGSSRVVDELLHHRGAVAVPVYAGCAAVVAWAGLRPSAVSANAAQLAAWILGLFGAGVALAVAAGGLRADGLAWSAVAVAVVLTAWSGWRRRDPLIASAAVPAVLAVAWPLLARLVPRQRAWLGVWAAFGLLGAAVWVAIRRARAGSPCRGPQAGEPAGDGRSR